MANGMEGSPGGEVRGGDPGVTGREQKTQAEGAVERLSRHLEAMSFRGRISNLIMAIDLYSESADLQRARAYARQALRSFEETDSSGILRALLHEQQSAKRVTEFDKNLPELVGLVRDLAGGKSIEKMALSRSKDFLLDLEETLTSVLESPEERHLERWVFRH